MQERQLVESFRKEFGTNPSLIVCAPGRVNLIGEHTDYNGGFVLPVALDRAVRIAARPNRSQSIVVYSIDFKESDRFGLSDIRPGDKRWGNYLRGVVKVMIEAGVEVEGFDAVVTGDVPQGAGLSSSAAFEVAVAFLLDAMSNSKIDKTHLLCLHSEQRINLSECNAASWISLSLHWPSLIPAYCSIVAPWNTVRFL